MIKSTIKKILPRNLLLFYHKVLALVASFLYGNPSEKLVVIGVTGTAGKSSTVYLIGKMLEKCGWKVGWTSSISFKNAEGEKMNDKKMTMPGRFFLQRFLKNLVINNHQAVIIETSSEGILQSRHLGINYDVALFTNLSPEHIEAHGSFEKYRQTKGELFKKLKAQSASWRTKLKTITQNLNLKKTIIVNLDDEHADYFLSFPADEYYGYALRDTNLRIHPSRQKTDPCPLGRRAPAGGNDTNKIKIIKAENISDAQFTINNLQFQINLPGEFNIYNALAALSVGQYLKVPLEQAKKSLESITNIPGRMEKIISQPFRVIVDYAHTPTELASVYQLLKLKIKNENEKLICVLGSCGGGRDKWKRPELGKLAAQYCDQIILTNEDPYDENPDTIINEIEAGLSQIKNYEIILDRREAIRKALQIAKENDIVVITGKGCEPWMCVANGKKIPWDDRKIVRQELAILSAKTNPKNKV